MGVLCIQHWHMEIIREEKDGELQDWTFSPSGVGQIEEWVLMGWSKKVKCNMGHYHSIDGYRFQPGFSKFFKQKEAPDVPKSVIAKLRKKVKGIKQANPWPGD